MKTQFKINITIHRCLVVLAITTNCACTDSNKSDENLNAESKSGTSYEYTIPSNIDSFEVDNLADAGVSNNQQTTKSENSTTSYSDGRRSKANIMNIDDVNLNDVCSDFQVSQGYLNMLLDTYKSIHQIRQFIRNAQQRRYLTTDEANAIRDFEYNAKTLNNAPDIKGLDKKQESILVEINRLTKTTAQVLKSYKAYDTEQSNNPQTRR